MKKIFLILILLTILTAGCITGTDNSVSYERGESKAITARMTTAGASMPAPQAEYEDRSEERRVGKECRSRWSPYH